MIRTKRIHLIAIALCLWLPLQAVAGQWLHCAKMDSVLGVNEKISDDKKNITTALPKHSCHQVATDNIKSIDNIKSDNDSTKKTCDHCQFVCHWNGVIVFLAFPELQSELAQHYSMLKIPFPVQPFQETPQRPPQDFTV